MENNKCKRCGRCCQHAYFDLHLEKGDSEQMIPWLQYHGQEVVKNGDKFFLKSLLPCMNLINNEDGTTSCKIYGNRPMICKKYSCEGCK